MRRRSFAPLCRGVLRSGRCARFVLLIGALAALPGCVERVLLVRSDPPGARVFLDGEDVGTTPARIPFEFYGTRELMVRMEETDKRGERSLAPETRLVKVRAPWHQWFPFDLATEFLWPGTIVDEHVVEFTLEPRDYDTWRANYEEGARARGIRFPTDPPPPEDGGSPPPSDDGENGSADGESPE